MTKDVCDCCGEVRELLKYNVVNIELNHIVAIIELCETCADKMEQEERLVIE